MKTECKSYHITSNTTNTPWTDNVQLLSLAVCVSAAGTTWLFKVQSKESTPKILYTATVTAGTTYLAFTDIGGVEMTSGVDIITVSGTPGTMDVWVSALRLGHD